MSLLASMCRQNPARSQLETPLHQGRSHTDWTSLKIEHRFYAAWSVDIHLFAFTQVYETVVL